MQLKTHPIELPEPLEDGRNKRDLVFLVKSFPLRNEIQLRRRAGKAEKAFRQIGNGQKTQKCPVAGLLVYGLQYVSISIMWHSFDIRRCPLPSAFLLFSHLAFRSPASGYSTLHKRYFLNFSRSLYDLLDFVLVTAFATIRFKDTFCRSSIGNSHDRLKRIRCKP